MTKEPGQTGTCGLCAHRADNRGTSVSRKFHNTVSVVHLDVLDTSTSDASMLTSQTTNYRTKPQHLQSSGWWAQCCGLWSLWLVGVPGHTAHTATHCSPCRNGWQQHSPHSQCSCVQLLRHHRCPLLVWPLQTLQVQTCCQSCLIAYSPGDKRSTWSAHLKTSTSPALWHVHFHSPILVLLHLTSQTKFQQTIIMLRQQSVVT